MEREKVKAFHKDLNEMLGILIKKHGFISARTGSISYTDDRLSGSFKVFAVAGVENRQEVSNLSNLGLKLKDKITINGEPRSKEYTVEGATNRGSLIVSFNGKRYRIPTRCNYTKVGEKTTTGVISDEIREKFEALVNRLSPENLCCDGEISRTATMQRKYEILREWKVLERQVGRKVTEDEIGSVLYARFTNKV